MNLPFDFSILNFCHLKYFFSFCPQVYETKSPEKTGIEVKSQGQLLSFRQISCVLPSFPLMLDGNPSKSSGIPARAFYIKVSNDGNNFSPQEVLIIIYDSKCIECSKNGTRKCNLKVAAIII